MDVERTDNFLPVLNLTEDVEKLALYYSALRAYTADHERVLLSVQRRLKAGKKQIDLCSRESKAIELKLNAVELKITETVLLNQESETETLQTVKENRSIKRKIIALKNDIEQQEKILKRANETMNAVRKNCIRSSKKLKVLPAVSTLCANI
ncbi:hypothetical protein X975_05605, partial [Stegodyphus mimosarum]